MTISVNTREYEIAHGKKPRGHGWWAFKFGDNRCNAYQTEYYWGNYGDAKKKATADAKLRNMTIITVGS